MYVYNEPPQAHCIKINIHFYGGLGSGRMVVGGGNMLGWRWSFCNVCSLVTVCLLLVFLKVGG